jgi:hypothetical protein
METSRQATSQRSRHGYQWNSKLGADQERHKVQPSDLALADGGVPDLRAIQLPLSFRNKDGMNPALQIWSVSGGIPDLRPTQPLKYSAGGNTSHPEENLCRHMISELPNQEQPFL